MGSWKAKISSRLGILVRSEPGDRRCPSSRNLPSLRQYVLVAQDRNAVDVFTRQPGDRWLLEAYTDPRTEIPLESIGCALPVGEIYDKVDFALPDEAPGAG